jgi:two-component system, OmpR family, heavy metal sensor histidine kinase CusS
MIRSLRLRLLLYTSTASAVILAVLGIALYAVMRQSLIANFNQSLLTEARAVAGTAEIHENNQIVFDYAPDELPKFVTKDHPDYFQAWIDSSVIIRSPTLGNDSLPRPDPGQSISFRKFTLPDGRPGRIVLYSLTTTIESNAGSDTSSAAQTPHTILLTVATESAALHDSLEGLQWLLSIACGLAVVLSGVVLMWVSGRAVRPVERLASDIERLRENELSVRLASPDAPTELQPVVDKLNGLLARISAAFSREKAFTADVAHELRTPLSALITTFDVCRSRPRDEAAYIAAIDKCRDVAQRMQAMIESLLLLARADAGQLLLKLQSVNAVDLLDDCWAMFSARSEERNIELQWNVPSQLTIQTDPEKLRIIFMNLFDNACSYVNDQGKIRVTAEITNGRFELEVANTGSSVSSADVERLFERFWRGDAARAATGVHCGLGLSLCQRLSRLLDGQINVQTSTNDWFVVRLTLPAVSQTPISAPTPPPLAPAPTPAQPEHASAH